MSTPVVTIPNTVYDPQADNPALFEQPKLFVRKKYLERFRAQHERGLRQPQFSILLYGLIDKDPYRRRALKACAASTGDRDRADRIVRESEASTEEFDAEQELHEEAEEDEEDAVDEDDDEEDDEEAEGELAEAAILQQQYAAAKADKDVPLPKFFPSPAPPLSSVTPLSMPVAIPQVMHTMLHSPFQLAYADVLAEAGVSKDDFQMFLKGMNAAVAQSPVFMVLGLASFATGFVNTWEMQLVSTVTWVVSEVGRVIQSKARADAFLEHANDIFFRPRGLVCTVVTNKIKEDLFANVAPTKQVEQVQLPTYDEALGLPPNANLSHLVEHAHASPPPATTTTPLSNGSTPSSSSSSPPQSTYAPLQPLKERPANPSAPKKFLDWAVNKQNQFQAFMSKHTDKKLAKKLEKVRMKGQRKMEGAILRGKGDRKIKKESRKMERKVRKVERKRERKAKTGGPFWLIILNDPDAPMRVEGPLLS